MRTSRPRHARWPSSWRATASQWRPSSRTRWWRRTPPRRRRPPSQAGTMSPSLRPRLSERLLRALCATPLARRPPHGETAPEARASRETASRLLARVPPGLGLGAPQHLHRPERVEAVDDHVDQPGPASRRPAATAVAALGDDLLHQLAGGPGDVGPPVEDLRDGRDRDPRLFGDLGDRHTAAFHARTLSKVSKIVVDTSHLDGPVRAL